MRSTFEIGNTLKEMYEALVLAYLDGDSDELPSYEDFIKEHK